MNKIHVSDWAKELLFEAIVDSTPGLLVTIDPFGTIFFVNPSAERLFGYSTGELIGKTIELLVPERFRTIHVQHRKHYLEAPTARPIGIGRDLYGRKKDGSEFPVEITLIPKSSDKGLFILAVVIDITERKTREAERERLLENERQIRLQLEQSKWRDSFLSEVSRVLGQSLDYEITLKSVAKVIVPQLADWCIVGLAQEDGPIRLLSLAADLSKAELVSQLEKFELDSNAPEGLSKVIRTGQPLLHSKILENDLFPTPDRWPPVASKDPRYLQLLRALGLKSYIAVPLSIRQKPIGALGIFSSKKGRLYSPADFELAKELGYRCSLAIENATLYREAQVAIQLREDFLSIASHELRTPLTSLTMQLQMINLFLAGGTLTTVSKEKLEQLAKISNQQIRRFTSLINDLMDVSRISGGHLVLNLEEVNLFELAQDTISGLKEESDKSHCPIVIHGETHIIGRWDRSRIAQILSNLLSNAMKYGAGKPIEITVQKKNENARLIVRDHGIGISKEDQTRIFQRFERAVSIRQFGGLGLGLFIVRQIAEAHGGTIRVDSVLGHGASFTVELPLQEGAAKLLIS